MPAPWEKYAAQTSVAPWEKYASQAPTPAEPTQLDAAGRGALQGASMGYADELAGALGAGGQALSKKKLTDLLNDYRAARDAYRAKDQAAKSKYPGTFVGSQLVGGLAGAMLPMGELGLAGKIAAGAGVGGAAGLGNSQADLTQGEVGQAAKDTALGAGVGAALGAASNMIPSAKELPAYAEKEAIRATGAAPAKALRFSPKAGRFLLDNGIVKFGSNPENIAENAEQALAQHGQTIGDALSKLEAEGTPPLNKTDLIQQMLNRANEMKQSAYGAPVARKLEQLAGDIGSPEVPTDLPLSQVEQMKRGFQGLSNYTKPNTTLAQKEAASILRQNVENAATAQNPELANTFTQAKDAYSILSPIQEAAKMRAMQTEQGIPWSLESMLARHVVPRYRSAMGVMADKLSNVANYMPGRTVGSATIGSDLRSMLFSNPHLANGIANPTLRNQLMGDVANRPQAPDTLTTPMPDEFGKKMFEDAP